MEPNLAESNADGWVRSSHPHFERLTGSIATTLNGALRQRGVDVLSVTGRTKTVRGANEKIKRKGYRNYQDQFTDFTGVRIIVYLESEVEKTVAVVRNLFEIDEDNSSDKVDELATNRVGYRSVHLVCKLGNVRSSLTENDGLGGLKFEVQVRTVLQHAWAEISHDRQYKFEGDLPPAVSRDINLYAGLLEIADKGFSRAAEQISDYESQVQEGKIGNDESAIDNITLRHFVDNWALTNEVELDDPQPHNPVTATREIVRELKEYGVTNILELKRLIPEEYVEVVKAGYNYQTFYGVVRDWMMIHDPSRFVRKVNYDWGMDDADRGFYEEFLAEDDVDLLFADAEARQNARFLAGLE